MATRLPRERESKVMRSIVVRLRRLGIVLYRRNTGAMRDGERFVRFASPGQADLYGWILPPHSRAGTHVEIEVKARGNKPTPKQLAWLLECHRLGAVAMWGDDCNVIERVAEAVLRGGKIVWCDDGTYDVEMPYGIGQASQAEVRVAAIPDRPGGPA